MTAALDGLPGVSVKPTPTTWWALEHRVETAGQAAKYASQVSTRLWAHTMQAASYLFSTHCCMPNSAGACAHMRHCVAGAICVSIQASRCPYHGAAGGKNRAQHVTVVNLGMKVLAPLLTHPWVWCLCLQLWCRCNWWTATKVTPSCW
jgi:hypothetical protein